MNKYLKIFTIIIFLFLLSACKDKDLTKGTIEKINYEETSEVTNYVKIETTKNKVILVELYPDIAPITVANFQHLVTDKFYDNLNFHRVIKNFVIQTGDPTGTGAGGSEETITGEFRRNGIDNNLSHTRGILSMARTANDFDSASSQFFICHKDAPSLDGEYAAFGKVIAGMSVVDAIANTQTDANDKPVNVQKIRSIRFIKID